MILESALLDGLKELETQFGWLKNGIAAEELNRTTKWVADQFPCAELFASSKHTRQFRLTLIGDMLVSMCETELQSAAIERAAAVQRGSRVLIVY